MLYLYKIELPIFHVLIVHSYTHLILCSQFNIFNGQVFFKSQFIPFSYLYRRLSKLESVKILIFFVTENLEFVMLTNVGRHVVP